MRWYDLRHQDTATVIAALLAALATLHLMMGLFWVALGMATAFLIISLWLWRGRALRYDRRGSSRS